MRSSLASSLISCALAASLLACGGKTPPPGSPTTSADAPEWVHRGTHVEKGKISGVGAVSGIKNTELARTTAINRGRAEISKVLETYSASLMKDYQESVKAGSAPSDEGQMVTQAIKTFSANLLEGTEPQGYWQDPANGAWYGLVVLDFERAKDIASAKSDMPSETKKWVEEHGKDALADLEKETRPPQVTPATPEEEAPTAEAPPPAAPSAPPAKGPGPAPKVGGDAPAWTKSNGGGACDSNKFLCGVGQGKDVTASDIAARAELARIFEANIKAVATSFEGAARTISSKTGEQWAEVQRVTSYSLVSTDKLVVMSEIRERWQDTSGKFWTLAVIDRAQAANALREQIQTLDGTVGSQLSRAEGASDNLTKFKALKQAAAALAEREALNADLRVIEKSGQGVPSPHNIGEVTAQLEGAAGDLSIGVAIAGSGSDRVQSCLEEGLTAKGYQVEAKATEEEDEDPDVSGSYDVILKGSVKAEKRGQIAGSEVVNITFTLKLINGATNKVLKTMTATKKASRGDVKSAASTAAHQMCTQKMPELVAGIDQYFSKK